MKDTQNITIVMLMLTAAVLTTLLVAGALYTEPTYATSYDRGGDYIMVTGNYESQDFVYVLDVAAAKLNLYYTDINTNQVKLGVSTDLNAVFK